MSHCVKSYTQAISSCESDAHFSVGCFADPRIMTVTGRSVSLIAPTPDSIRLEDIAVGLANTCRYGGQVRQHYSVAEHSVACANDAWKIGQRADVCLAVLFHDASEAYLGDVIRPLKVMLGDVYSKLEESMSIAVAEHFDLPNDSETHAVIKAHDQAICEQEMLAICPEVYEMVRESFEPCLCGYSAEWFTPRFLSPHAAAQEFRDCYTRLLKDLRKVS